MASPFRTRSFAGFTNQSIGGGLFAGGNPVYGGGLIDNTYSYIDNLTWQHGLHSISMGVEALRYQNNYPTGNNDGYLGSLNLYRRISPAILPWQMPEAMDGADFVLDRVSQAGATLASVNVGQRQWRIAGYAQDDYQIRPNLTLNVGLRYEYDEPWIEENNKTGNIDLSTGQVIYAGQVPTGAPAGSGVCNNRGLLPAKLPAVDAAAWICLSADRSRGRSRRLWSHQLL